MSRSKDIAITRFKFLSAAILSVHHFVAPRSKHEERYLYKHIKPRLQILFTRTLNL